MTGFANYLFIDAANGCNSNRNGSICKSFCYFEEFLSLFTHIQWQSFSADMGLKGEKTLHGYYHMLIEQKFDFSETNVIFCSLEQNNNKSY